MRKHNPRRIVMLLVGASASTSILADVIQVDFSFPTSPYLNIPNGTPVSGTFSFDNSSYTAGGTFTDSQNGLPLLSLSFDWLGTQWSTANTSLASLTFGSDGSLQQWRIGGNYASCFGDPLDCVGISPQTDFRAGAAGNS